MRQHDIRAMLAESIITDPDLSEAQQAGYRTGWQLAASTPGEELVESAINLVAEALHANHDEESMGRLLGFLAFQQALTQRLADALHPGDWLTMLRRLFAR